jgi:hypothetical protein
MRLKNWDTKFSSSHRRTVSSPLRGDHGADAIAVEAMKVRYW